MRITKPSHSRPLRLTRQQGIFICILILLGGAWMIFHVGGKKAAPVQTGDFKDGEWVYFESEAGLPEEVAPYVGRPGQFVFQEKKPFVKYHVESYELNAGLMPPESVTDKSGSVYTADHYNRVSVDIKKAKFKRCPPGQEDVADRFMGVLRVWKEPEYGKSTTETQKGANDKAKRADSVNEARVEDNIVVELKNFDWWLMTEYGYGHLRSDLESLPKDFREALRDSADRRRSGLMYETLKAVIHLMGEWNNKKRVHSEAVAKQAGEDKEDLDDKQYPDRKQSVEEKEKERKAKIWHEVRDRIGEYDTLQTLCTQTGIPQISENPSPEEESKIEAKLTAFLSALRNLAAERMAQLTLTLDGVVLTGATPLNSVYGSEVLHPTAKRQGAETRPSFDHDTYNWLQFDLKRTEKDDSELGRANAAAWAKLLRTPDFRKATTVTLTLPEPGGSLQLDTKVLREGANPELSFYLIEIDQRIFFATLVVFFCILALLLNLARTTNILRDTSGDVRPDGIEPVSLAKTQMAFWFILTAAAFLFLYVATGEFDTINKTCLILLGLGTATALGSAFIPPAHPSTGGRRYLVTCPMESTRTQVEDELKRALVMRLEQLWPELPKDDLETRRQVVGLLRRLAPADEWAAIGKRLEFPAGEEGATLGEGERSHRQVREAIERLVQRVQRSQATGEAQRLTDEIELVNRQWADFQKMATGWGRLFSDLLSETHYANAFEFHRFQMVAWTLLLGFVFLGRLLSERRMPEFGDMTLALLGISGGTYIGFKVPAALAGRAPEPAAAAIAKAGEAQS